MAQIVINDAFVQDFVPVIIEFLEKKSINTVKVEFFSLETDDAELEDVKLDDLEDKLDDLSKKLDEEITSFHVKAESISCYFDYDGSDFIINYPDDLEEEMQVFKDLQE